MFKRLAKNASEGYESIVWCQRVVAFLKTGITLDFAQSRSSMMTWCIN